MNYGRTLRVCAKLLAFSYFQILNTTFIRINLPAEHNRNGSIENGTERSSNIKLSLNLQTYNYSK